MKAPGKLTLILMHDDGKAHRLRVGRKLFVVLATLMVLLPTLGGLGIWVGIEAWNVWRVFELERVTLQRSADQWRMKAEQLGNVVRLAGLENEVDSQMLAVPAMATAGKGFTAPTAAAVSPPAAPQPASQNATLPASRNATQTVANATMPASANATLPAANATLPVDPKTPPAVEADAAMDTGVVRVENLTARVQDNHKLRVALDLYNAKPTGGPVSGRFVLQLIDPSGKHLPLRHDEGTFRITRFKKVVMQAELPDELAAADNAALHLTVLVDDEPVMRNIYSIESR